MNLRVLIIEDDEADAILLVRELRRAGYDLTFQQVDTRDALEEALDSRSWDLVISDYEIPGFSGLTALDIVKSKGLDVPFIILSGVIMEEMAVVAMRGGAHDCIMKDNLARLFPAVERELKEAEIRRERRRAEIELRKSEERYRQLYEESKKAEELYRSLVYSSPDAIAIYDLQGNVKYISPSFTRTFGYTLEELRDGSASFASDSENKAAKTVIRDIIENGTPYQGFETNQYRKDGRRIEVSVSASRYNDHEGNPAGILTIFRDITETKKLELQLRQAQKMEAIGTLAGGVAHDFNNILAAIIGFTELSLMSVSENSKIHFNLQQIINSGIRARDLIKQIMAFSRMVEHEITPVQAGAVVEESLELLSATLPSTIEIRKNIRTDLTVMADPTQVQQVVMNLCTNAAHAMKEKGGVLEVALEESSLDKYSSRQISGLNPGKYLKLTIADSGHGMDRETLDRIFDPFFTTKEKGDGTGMGLSVVHGIVKSHNGGISVYSEPDRGSTFNVYLPLLDSAAVAEKAIDGAAPVPRGRESILFVDDEALLVELGRQMLETLGYRVTGQTSSKKALDLFKKNPERFDVVITDYTMPQMTGMELAAEILKLKPDTPIIICTGFSERISDDKAAAIGIKRFALKPVPIHKLARYIREIMTEKTPDAISLTGAPYYIEHVLLAEDDAINRKLVSLLLEKSGCGVVQVKNGIEAVEAWENRHFDLILMDINMPEMNGLEAAGIIRQREKGAKRRVPIIALSGHTYDEKEKDIQAAGMDGYLSKPFQLKEFFDLIEKLTPEAPGTAATGRETGSDAPSDDGIIDKTALMALVNGDRELLEDIIHLFLRELPNRMSEIKRAIVKRSGPEIELSAHTLYSSLASLSASASKPAARHLEEIGRTLDLDQAETAYHVLDKEIGRLKDALNRMI